MAIDIFSPLLSQIVSIYGANSFHVQRIIAAVNTSPALEDQWRQAELFPNAGAVISIGVPRSEATNANADRVLLAGQFFDNPAGVAPDARYGQYDLIAALSHELQHSNTYHVRLAAGDTVLQGAGSGGALARSYAAGSLDDELSSKVAEFNALNAAIPGDAFDLFNADPAVRALNEAKAAAISSRIGPLYFGRIEVAVTAGREGTPIEDEYGNVIPTPSLFAAMGPVYSATTGAGEISTYESQQLVNGLNRFGTRLPEGAVISTTLDPQLLANAGFAGNAVFVNPNTGVRTAMDAERLSPGSRDTRFTYSVELDGVRVVVAGSVTADAQGNRLLTVTQATALNWREDPAAQEGTGTWVPRDITPAAQANLQSASTPGQVGTKLDNSARSLLNDAASALGVAPPVARSTGVTETMLPAGALNSAFPANPSLPGRIEMGTNNEINFIEAGLNGTISYQLDANRRIISTTTITPLLQEDGTPIANSYAIAQRDAVGNLIASGVRQTFEDSSALETTTTLGGTVVTRSFDTDNHLAGTVTTTPSLDEYNTPVANTFEIITRDGAGNLLSSGTRFVNPIDGSTQGTTLQAASPTSPTNPVGGISASATDAQGNSRPVSNLDALNNQAQNAQNLLDAQALINALRSGNTAGAVGSGLRLANTYTDGRIPELGQIGGGLTALSSLYGLHTALQSDGSSLPLSTIDSIAAYAIFQRASGQNAYWYSNKTACSINDLTHSLLVNKRRPRVKHRSTCKQFNSTPVAPSAGFNITNQQATEGLNALNAFLGAIRGGQPVPLVTSGFGLLYTLGGRPANLQGANTFISGLGSVYGLHTAFQSGGTGVPLNTTDSIAAYAIFYWVRGVNGCKKSAVNDNFWRNAA